MRTAPTAWPFAEPTPAKRTGVPIWRYQIDAVNGGAAGMRALLTARRTLLCAAVLGFAGCGGTDTPTTGDPAPTSEPAVTVPAGSEPVATPDQPSDGAVITGAAPRQIVDDLIERVSEEAGVDLSDVVVVGSFAKTWTGGSLGCAEPGIVHTKRAQAGYQIELTAGGESWDFRVRESGEVIACREGVVVRSEAGE